METDYDNVIAEVLAIHSALKKKFPLAADDKLLDLVRTTLEATKGRGIGSKKPIDLQRRIARLQGRLLLQTAEAIFPIRSSDIFPSEAPGHCFSFCGKGPCLYPGDSNESTHQSRLMLLEDGHVIGPAHISHADIKKNGAGRFSHWGNTLFFSASDNSVPSTNGKTYQIVYPHPS